MGSFGFGQGYFGSYGIEVIEVEPPSHISTTELEASFVAASEHAASYVPSTDLPASLEGTD